MIDKFDGEYEFLSNFSKAKLAWEGQEYPTSEHAFQAAKTLDPAERAAIAALPTPGKAKRAGAKVDLRPGWNKIRTDVMLEIVEAKFKQNKWLMSLLLLTGDEELVEGNKHGGVFWGTVDGVGHNFLGKILMIVRDEARGA